MQAYFVEMRCQCLTTHSKRFATIWKEMVFKVFRFRWEHCRRFKTHDLQCKMISNVFSTFENALRCKNGSTLISLSLVFPNRVAYALLSSNRTIVHLLRGCLRLNFLRLSLIQGRYRANQRLRTVNQLWKDG